MLIIFSLHWVDFEEKCQNMAMVECLLNTLLMKTSYFLWVAKQTSRELDGSYILASRPSTLE